MKRRWIFLRGLMRDARHFEDFPAHFETALNSEVLCLDLPGNGRLHRQSSKLSVSAMARAVQSQAREQFLQPPYSILAMSLGAMVALEWACQSPSDLNAMVLINTSAKGLAPFYKRLQWQNYQRIYKDILRARNPVSQEKAIVDLTVNLNNEKEKLVRRWTDYAKMASTSKANGLIQLAAAATYQLPKQLPQIPTLILRSLGDRLVSPEASYNLWRRGGYQMSTHKTAGHELILDDPNWVIDEVAKWLKRTEIQKPR